MTWILEVKLVKNKIFKSIIILSLIALSTSVVTACGKKADTASSSAASEQGSASSGAVSVEVPPMSSNGIMYGVIIEASEKYMTLQSDMGTTVRFGLNKDIDVTGLKDGIAAGEAVKVEYKGELKGDSAKKVKVNKVSDSEKLPKLSKEALVAAGSIILAVRNKDQSSLARLCEYPLVFDTGTDIRIGSVQEFISLKKSDVFTKRLVSSVSKTNLFVTNAYSDGFLLGLSEPNLVVSSTKDGYLITGFHYK